MHSMSFSIHITCGRWKTRICLILLFMLISITGTLRSQVQEAWRSFYDYSYGHPDWANSVAVDDMGNVYVTGNSWRDSTKYDFCTIKYDSNGSELWVERYNGPGNDYDWPESISLDQERNVYVTGYSADIGEWPDFFDFLTLKYDSEGNLLWLARYNGPDNACDWSCRHALDAEGNVYVTGGSRHGSGIYEDYVTIKYDTNGNLLWVGRYGTATGSDFPFDIGVDGEGNVYVTGGSWGMGHTSDVTTIKYDPDGNELWIARYNSPSDSSDVGWAMAVSDEGNVYVTGYTMSHANELDYLTLKYDTNGFEQWVASYDGPGSGGDDWSWDIDIDRNGNAYITGFSDDVHHDYATIKYDTKGNEMWVSRYNGPGNYHDDSYAIVVDNYGNSYVTGRCAVTGHPRYDCTTVKYDPHGNQCWVTNLDVSSRDEGRAIAIDDHSCVYVVGKVGINNDDYVTVKYRQYPLFYRLPVNW